MATAFGAPNTLCRGFESAQKAKSLNQNDQVNGRTADGYFALAEVNRQWRSPTVDGYFAYTKGTGVMATEHSGKRFFESSFLAISSTDWTICAIFVNFEGRAENVLKLSVLMKIKNNANLINAQKRSTQNVFNKL
ncbi:hypothetical protein niasHT_029549 [Heterodera trifolii]|uniref:Uncharacterized protein n=1 Tax=Heterodera trifolii TaxID=157864 RepID=A0ABD2JB42_9BILA